MKRIPVLLLLLVLAALAGCQTIKAINPFHHQDPAYKSAQQEPPLEVPPGMDQPSTSEALTIPDAGSATSATAGAVATPPSVSGPPPVAVAEARTAASMTLADTPDSAYRRVGLALARGDVGQVVTSDDAAHSYQVAVDTVVTKKAEGGFFYRLFHRDKQETVKGAVAVSIGAQDDGSVIRAVGDAEAVKRVIAMLKQRLK